MASTAQAVPAGFVDETVASGFVQPVALAFAPDGRVFVTEQGGAVRVVQGGELRATPFATFVVDHAGERGLLGVAVPPDFATRPLLYVYHTVPGTPSYNRVSRLDASGEVAPADGAVTLLDLDPLGAVTYHNGGALHFGRDGKLYVSVGDAGTRTGAQSLLNRFGKILRLNPDGSIPADNPTSFPGIAGTTTGANRAIWAVGLRNPFTFAVQRNSGRIFINDVGRHAFEEINLGVKGANYGWPASEGPTSNPNFTGPLYTYGHEGAAPAGCAISGGTFYNPLEPSFPSAYRGKYFFADYCSDWLYYLDPANPGTATPFHTGLSGAVDLAVGPEGALYYLQRGDGSLHRIRYTGLTKQAIQLSATQLEVREGGEAVVAVRLAAAPAAALTVTVGRLPGDPVVTRSPASLTFTPADWATDQLVTIAAGQDGDWVDDGASFVLSAPGVADARVWVTAVDDDRPAGAPQAIITLPRNGDVVSGATAEFFGDGLAEDGTTVRAQFLVDGALAYTDVNGAGHYHIGGTHNRWDTTRLSNGAHILMMRVRDRQGLWGSASVRVTVRN